MTAVSDRVEHAPAPITVSSQPTATVRCVLENSHRSIVEATTLVRSLRAFGGALADAPCELHFVESMPEDTSELSALGATCRIVPRFDERCPHANKLGMFYPVETDYLVAVDADIVFCDDISHELLGSAIAAAPANGDNMPLGRWAELFSAANLPMPADRLITMRSRQETVPYFNSGALIVPADAIEELREQWVCHLLSILDAAPSREWWKDLLPYFADQIAFTLAMCSGRFTRRVLGLEMNWILIYDDFPDVIQAHERKPVLLHTGHEMDYETGRILKSVPYEHALAAIDRYNALLP